MTTEIKLAHIHKNGQDIIIVPRNGASMNQLSPENREQMMFVFQAGAEEAGLKGTVCLVWEAGHTFHFVAPAPWHPFFRSIDMAFVHSNLNRKLTISYSD